MHGRLPEYRRSGGFTLIELLAVVAVLLLLLSILLPTLSSVRERGYRAVCVSNMRQLQLAHTQFSAEHSGTMPDSETGNNCWVDVSLGYDTLASLTEGTLWPYVNDDKVYRCFLHPSLANKFGGSVTNFYFRDYSISGYLNGTPASWGYPLAQKQVSGVPKPGSTISFVEEADNRKYLMGSWVTYMDVPRIDQWVDTVGFWHNGGENYAFLDGHTEYWRWQDARTLLIGFAFFYSEPGSPDLYNVKRHIAPCDPAFQAMNDALATRP